MNAAAAANDPHHPSVIPPSPVEDEEMENTLDELARHNNAAASSSPWHPTVGGITTIPCFALLAGVFMDPSSSSSSRRILNVPISHLPAVIGRTHESSNDPSFFGLGKYKALSRQQCRILYLTDVYGGQLVVNTDDDGGSSLSYKPPTAPRGVKLEIIRGDNAKTTTLPTNGFFVIECLGKNRIVVDKQRVEHGQMALLLNGSKVRISGYFLHFLLPTTDETTTTNNNTMMVPNPEYMKRPVPASLKQQQQTTNKRKKKDYSLLSTQELLDAFFEADWENHSTKQMNTELLLRAVKAAARDESLREQAAEKKGLPRTAIMEWMEESSTFGAWMEEALARMEAATLQGKVRKGMLAAGYKQDPTTAGMSARWMLPPLDNESEEEQSGSDDDDDDKEEEEEEAENESERQQGGVLGSLSSAKQERSDGNAAEQAQESASEEQASPGSGIDSPNEAQEADADM